MFNPHSSGFALGTLGSSLCSHLVQGTNFTPNALLEAVNLFEDHILAEESDS